MPSEGIGDSLWQACVDQLAQELSEQQFNTWIKPLTAKVTDDLSRVTVFVANRFKLDWTMSRGTSVSETMAIDAGRLTISRGASANSMITGWP